MSVFPTFARSRLSNPGRVVDSCGASVEKYIEMTQIFIARDFYRSLQLVGKFLRIVSATFFRFSKTEKCKEGRARLRVRSSSKFFGRTYCSFDRYVA